MNFQTTAMGAPQLGSLCVRIRACCGLKNSDIDVAVIFADPTAQELDYLFGNRNLTKYVLRHLTDWPAAATTNDKQHQRSGNDENGFLDSLDYIASHLKAELANGGGNLNIATVKDEIKTEESLDTLLGEPVTTEQLFNGTNGCLDLAGDEEEEEEEEFLLRDDGHVDEDDCDTEEEEDDGDDYDDDVVEEKRIKRTTDRRSSRRLTRRVTKRPKARLKERESDTELDDVLPDKKYWPYVKVRNLRFLSYIFECEINHTFTLFFK